MTCFFQKYINNANHFLSLSLSKPPENIRKPGFLMFSGGIKRDQWHEIFKEPEIQGGFYNQVKLLVDSFTQRLIQELFKRRYTVLLSVEMQLLTKKLFKKPFKIFRKTLIIESFISRLIF